MSEQEIGTVVGAEASSEGEGTMRSKTELETEVTVVEKRENRQFRIRMNLVNALDAFPNPLDCLLEKHTRCVQYVQSELREFAVFIRQEALSWQEENNEDNSKTGQNHPQTHRFALYLLQEIQAKHKAFSLKLCNIQKAIESEWTSYIQACEYVDFLANNLDIGPSSNDVIVRYSQRLINVSLKRRDQIVDVFKQLKVIIDSMHTLSQMIPNDNTGSTTLVSNNSNTSNHQQMSRKRKASAVSADRQDMPDSTPPSTMVRIRYDTDAGEELSIQEQFGSIPYREREDAQHISVVFPEVCTPAMEKNLCCIIRQALNLNELVLENPPTRRKLGLAQVAELLFTAKFEHLRRFCVQGTTLATDGALSEEKLGSVMAGLPQCLQVDLEKVEGNFSVDAWISAQLVMTDPSENHFSVVAYKTQQHDDSYSTVHQRRFKTDTHEAQLVSTLDDLVTKTNLVQVRIDLAEALDASQLVEPLTKLLIDNRSLSSFHLTNANADAAELLDQLIRALAHSTVSDFAIQVQEETQNVIAEYSSALTEMVQKNVYLEHFSIRGKQYAMVFDWEAQKTMYLMLNQCGRRQLQNEDADVKILVSVLDKAKDDLTSNYYFLSHKPSLWARS